MTHDPGKVTFRFISRPVVETDGTHVRIRAFYNEGAPGLEESAEIKLTLGYTDPGDITVACCENAQAWAASLGGNITTEIPVQTDKSIAASAELAKAAAVAAKEEMLRPVEVDEYDI
jgi:hypothetical protein